MFRGGGLVYGVSSALLDMNILRIRVGDESFEYSRVSELKSWVK